MSSTEPKEQQKSTLSILSDKIDRLENLFLEAFTNPNTKPTETNKSEFLYVGYGKFNSFDELQQEAEKKLSYLLRTACDLTNRMENLIFTLSNLEEKANAYKIEEVRPAKVKTPAPMQQVIPINPHMFAPGSRQELAFPAQQQYFPERNFDQQFFKPILQRFNYSCLTFMELINYLHSHEVDLDGMLDPHIVVSLDHEGRFCLNYNPHDLPQTKIASKFQVINQLVNSYQATCSAYSKQLGMSNTLVVLSINDEKGGVILVKDVETFINWIIDNEMKKKNKD